MKEQREEGETEVYILLRVDLEIMHILEDEYIKAQRVNTSSYIYRFIRTLYAIFA